MKHFISVVVIGSIIIILSCQEEDPHPFWFEQPYFKMLDCSKPSDPPFTPDTLFSYLEIYNSFNEILHTDYSYDYFIQLLWQFDSGDYRVPDGIYVAKVSRYHNYKWKCYCTELAIDNSTDSLNYLRIMYNNVDDNVIVFKL